MKIVKTMLIPVVALTMIAGSFGVAQAATKTVKIGNIIPLSGPSASVGIQGKNAREMAVQEINDAGGIKSMGGAKLEMLYADSKSDPTAGVSAAEQMINSDKVALLTGCWNSAVTYPTTQVAERYGVPFVVPVSVRDTITERGFKYTFRVAAKDSWWTRDQFAFLKDMAKETGTKIKTVAFVYENGDWGTGFAAGWKKLAKAAGYKVVLDEPYPSTASDLTPVVLKIKRAKPDVLFLTSNASDAILLTNTIANMKVHVKAIIGSGGGHADPAFLTAVGKNAEGIFDIGEWETDLNKPGVDEANAKYNKLYGYNLSGEAVDAYSSMYLIKAALETAGSTDPVKLRQALADTKLCSGPGSIFAYKCIDFDKDGQNKQAALVVVQIHNDNGTMKRFTVWPKEGRHAGYTPTFPMAQ
ncbi:ABC transporter substrate-binding protein [Geopsychrobacter electrodiphilus]|uniref:ABC transporter substrate-binding protein n=1 Tax=Geopsychrobacter electrodiphilus TaxID=225196 RepID=UPI00037A844D|nr:ABC transporter substrate-binding protein [Geopsychrobacter electrodiphilus]